MEKESSRLSKLKLMRPPMVSPDYVMGEPEKHSVSRTLLRRMGHSALTHNAPPSRGLREVIDQETFDGVSKKAFDFEDYWKAKLEADGRSLDGSVMGTAQLDGGATIKFKRESFTGREITHHMPEGKSGADWTFSVTSAAGVETIVGMELQQYQSQAQEEEIRSLAKLTFANPGSEKQYSALLYQHREQVQAFETAGSMFDAIQAADQNGMVVLHDTAEV